MEGICELLSTAGDMPRNAVPMPGRVEPFQNRTPVLQTCVRAERAGRTHLLWRRAVTPVPDRHHY